MPERPRSPEIESLVDELSRRLTEVVENAIVARTRVLTEDFLRAAMGEALAPAPLVASEDASSTATREPHVSQTPTDVPPVRRRAPRTRQPRTILTQAPPAIAPDPAEERRIAERARLRAILRPPPPVPAAATPAPLAPPASEEDGLKALEDEIREQIPAFAGLSQSRYTARIAAWVGRVRMYQSGPHGERTRIASRILFDKLRSLASSMDAGPIQGLDLSWSTTSWDRYIEENERLAATPDELPSKPEPEFGDVWSAPGDVDTPH